MADYDVTQLTDGVYVDDLYFPITRRPSISNDGRRVVYASRLVPERPGYAIWLYDRDRDTEPRQLTVDARGESKPLMSPCPQISGDGRRIVFYAPGYYTEEDETGIYVYDIESGQIRLVVADQIPRFETGAARPGEPGLRKYACSKPSISADGRWLAYVWTDYEYAGAVRDNWGRTRERLMLADIGGDSVRGGTVLEVLSDNAFGNGIRSLRMSGDGRHIAFYAGGVVRGLDIENVDMPPYEPVAHGEHVGPTCDVYCYLVSIRAPGSYTLRAVPEPGSSRRPLVVAHPESSNVQSFRTSSVLANPPSLCDDGSRLALSAGLVMRADDTGIYIYESRGSRPGTHPFISFGEVPGAAPEDRTLVTGAAPALSADGHWLAYYRREVTFPPGYGDSDHYEEGETYCSCVNVDELVVSRLPSGESSTLIASAEDAVCAVYTPNQGVGVSAEATHLAFLSRADKVARNRDLSHELYYASLSH